MPAPRSQVSRALPSAVRIAALAAAAAVACDPALETPPLGPDASTPAGAGSADAGRDAGTGAPLATDSSAPATPEAGPSSGSDAAPPCSAGETASCTCAGTRDDGSPLEGEQVCAEGVLSGCRCLAGDGGALQPVPSCGSARYAGPISGSIAFAGLNPAVQPEAGASAIVLQLGPADAAGRRAVTGKLTATASGISPLTGELTGTLSCASSPPALTAQATAELTWLGTTYALTGEFTADLTAGALSNTNWYLATADGTSASGQGTWSATPQ